MSKEKGFMYTDEEIVILKNFSSINASMILSGDGLSVINNSKSVIGVKNFDTPHDHEPFGVYETSEFLTAIGAMKDPKIIVSDKYLTIMDGSAKLKYFTTAQDLLPKVPDVAKKFAGLDCDLDFTITADKLAFVLKMATILKSKFLFFETDGKKIRITAGDELASSNNSYVIEIEDGIEANKLEGPVKITLDFFKLLPGDYKVSLSPKISKWESTNGIIYYVGCSAV